MDSELKSLFCPTCKGEIEGKEKRLTMLLFGIPVTVCNACGVLFVEQDLISDILKKVQEQTERRVQLIPSFRPNMTTH